MLAVAALAAQTASAKIAVFTDGRILKVEDAELRGDRIVLQLPGGGVLEVPALRIDRVVEDEIPQVIDPLPAEPDCDPRWVALPLPPKLPFGDLIEANARAADLHPWLLAAVVQAESAFDPGAVSRAGAAGLTQLMPSAALDHGVRDVFDPAENLRGGASHLRTLLDRFGSLSLALAAYNAGAATVERYGGVPPYQETRSYVRRVLKAFCPAAMGSEKGSET